MEEEKPKRWRRKVARSLPLERETGMNRMKLVEEVAAEMDCSKPKAAEAVDAMLEVIGRSLASGRSVRITGLGTLKVTKRTPRFARNPQNGDRVPVDGANTVKFVVGTRLEDIMNGRYRLKKGERVVTKKPKRNFPPAGKSSGHTG